MVKMAVTGSEASPPLGHRPENNPWFLSLPSTAVPNEKKGCGACFHLVTAASPAIWHCYGEEEANGPLRKMARVGMCVLHRATLSLSLSSSSPQEFQMAGRMVRMKLPNSHVIPGVLTATAVCQSNRPYINIQGESCSACGKNTQACSDQKISRPALLGRIA